MTLPPFGESRDVPDEKGHYHERTTEIYCFTQGSGRMLLNGHWQDVASGSSVLVPPRVMHTVSAGEQGLACIVWTIPAFDPADIFDLFDYPPEFCHFDPYWTKTLPTSPATEPLTLHNLFEGDGHEFGYVQLAPHATVPLHQHDRKEEAYFILRGSAEMVLGTQRTTIGPSCFVSIPDYIDHSITAGPAGVSYLEACVFSS